MKARQLAALAALTIGGFLGIGRSAPAPSLAAQHQDTAPHQTSNRYAALMGHQAMLNEDRPEAFGHRWGWATPSAPHRLNQRQIRQRRRRAQKWPAARKRH